MATKNETIDHQLPNPSSGANLEESQLLAGFNGRLNKLPDTCYTWWNSGALSLLGEDNLVSRGPARRFILEKTQHLIGGFAKYAGGPPDVYHGYMGLAALANMGEPGLAKFDPRLCISADAAARIFNARNALLNPAKRKASSEDGDDDD
ncbi:hypothetical protein NPX13_g9497 [Xylaria arbuscula]|uniref:Prenyltransferase alpha-alpha toroid domain-containing protein n=1 Tax=Xylaria arbuscula TaxID=114810 RepID=A0A9W8N6Q1_9PEZI|nr:hypothetical protein NPX13_g9497 [Xylaria arbuscula]